MKLARVGPRGQEVPVVVTDEGYRDLRAITADIDPAFLGAGEVDRIAGALTDLPVLDVPPDIRVGAPLTRPGAVFCIGMNYAAHAAESGAVPPDQPVVFLKTPSSLAGPDDDLRLPRASVKTDWEVELGVVIGRTALYLDSPQQAMDHVAGFVLANDLSERAFQLDVSGGQWSKGKIAPGFSPLGPWLVTPDEVDHRDLRLRSWVGGDARQDSSTADMVFDVPTIIHHLSQFTELQPGDVVLTGTPEGVALSGRFPYLRAGDVVEVEITGLGRQRQHVLAPSGGRA